MVSVGASSFVKPTNPSLVLPGNSNTCDLFHCGGVFPSASSTFAETNGKVASGMSVFWRYAAPRSKLWFPRPSMSIPIRFMVSIAGVSPNAFEIGGVAPTESPAAISITLPAPPASAS